MEYIKRGPTHFDVTFAITPLVSKMMESSLTYNSHGEEVTLAYQLHGSGDTKLLMISGMNTNGSIWKHLIPYLKNYTICTFDLRGTGSSSVPSNYSVNIFAEDAIAVVDRLKWNKFNICGISMGGMTCLKLVQKCPERITSQTLMSTALQGLGVESWTATILLFYATLIAIIHRQWRFYFILPLLFPMKHLRSRHADGRRYWRHVIDNVRSDFGGDKKPPLRSTMGHMKAVTMYKIPETEIKAIKLLDIPSVVIGGNKDILVRPKFTSRVAAKLAYPLHILDGVGHAPIAQEGIPERLADIMMTHIGDLNVRSYSPVQIDE